MLRPHHFGLRLSFEELARIEAAAAAAGTRPTAWLRGIALAATAAVVPPRAPAEAETSAAARLARTVSTRLTTAQYETLHERAQACGLPVASYVRRAVLGAAPLAPTRRIDVRPAIAALNQVGNNLNQLTKLANQGTVLPVEIAGAVGRVLAEVRRVRDAILQVDE